MKDIKPNKVTKMKAPQMLEFTKEIALAVSDLYEYTMADANILEGIEGKKTVFDFVVRELPTSKPVGTFMHNGVKYEELAKREFLVNAGLEQAVAYFLQAGGNSKLREYLETQVRITNEKFLNWAENISFSGDLYAMREGTIFFGQEQQLRVHERFEEAQVFESLLCSTINPQTNVATAANDIAAVANKILLEGGSRRGGSPQGAIFNSRAARIGGFTASSNVAYGMLLEEIVGGTHGHSYVMLHPHEYAAFKAQAKSLGLKVCFLLDTYNVEQAFETALKVAQEEHLDHFAFRLDSGDLLKQAKWIHQQMTARGYARSAYALVASDDLTAVKIARLEREGADIDKYLVGTYVVNPPKTVPGVYKLAAFHETDGQWVMRGKISEDTVKATLPGMKQVYRITGPDGYFKRDMIALEGEDISKYVETGDSLQALLVPVILSGRQVYEFPSVTQISNFRKEQLAKFKDIANYEVIVSDAVREMQHKILQEHGMLGQHQTQ